MAKWSFGQVGHDRLQLLNSAAHIYLPKLSVDLVGDPTMPVDRRHLAVDSIRTVTSVTGAGELTGK